MVAVIPAIVEEVDAVGPSVRMGTPFWVSVAQVREPIRALNMVAAAKPRNLRLVDMSLTSWVISFQYQVDINPDLDRRETVC